MRIALFQTEFPRVELPEPAGDMMSITEKIYVPKNEFPDVCLEYKISENSLLYSTTSSGEFSAPEE